MDENQKSLENLIVDEQKISKDILHDLLSDYIRIGKQSGDLIPQSAFQELTAKEKVVIVLLSQRARHELGMVDTEWMGPSKISEQSGVKKGTVYPTVRELSNDGFAEDGEGSYRIPAHSIQRAREYIQRGEDNE